MSAGEGREIDGDLGWTPQTNLRISGSELCSDREQSGGVGCFRDNFSDGALRIKDRDPNRLDMLSLDCACQKYRSKSRILAFVHNIYMFIGIVNWTCSDPR